MRLFEEICTIPAVEARAWTRNNELAACMEQIGQLEQYLRSQMLAVSSTSAENEIVQSFLEPIWRQTKDFLYWGRQDHDLLKYNPDMCYNAALLQPQPESKVYQNATHSKKMPSFTENTRFFFLYFAISSPVF